MNLTLIIGEKSGTKVTSLEKASEEWQKVRTLNHWGVRDMPEVYVLEGNKKVARISYNGRCWHPTSGAEISLKTGKAIEREVQEGW